MPGSGRGSAERRKRQTADIHESPSYHDYYLFELRSTRVESGAALMFSLVVAERPALHSGTISHVEIPATAGCLPRAWDSPCGGEESICFPGKQKSMMSKHLESRNPFTYTNVSTLYF